MFTHHLLELICRIRIKSHHRLVEYPYRWIVHKRSYDHHLLAHTVGIADHLSVQAVLPTKALRPLLYPLLSLGGRRTIYINDEIDILKSRKSEKYIRIVMPSTVEKDWIFGEHPLVARLASDEERVWSLFRGATWWLPLSDSFLFQGSLPTDDTAAIATLGGLRKELEKLNQLAWQADEDTILGWADTEGYPVDGTVDSDGQYSKADIPEHTQYDTQSLAKFAFSMFWRAMRFAEEQQVPILLDY